MLVLARRLHERIIIPAIRTSIEITAFRPGLVRLGIEAPPEVTVLREEVYRRDKEAAERPTGTGPETRPAPAPQAWRHRLNNLTLGLALMRQQLPVGAAPDLGGTLGRMEEEVRALCREIQALAGDGPPPPPTDPCAPALTVEVAPACRV